jgi:DMSO/TMAO reductase YedYZ molybdopterin-dependent catalytic subunit
MARLEERPRADPEPVASPRPVPRWTGALMGVLVLAVSLGVGQVVAATISGLSSPLLAVGETAIDATPEWLKSFAIRTFGSHDKGALLVGIVVVLGMLSAAIGIASRRYPWVGYAGLIALTALGIAAALGRPAATASWVLPSLVAGLAGIGAFVLLTHSWKPKGGSALDEDPAVVRQTPAGFDRREFLASAGAMVAAAAAAGGLGKLLESRQAATSGRQSLRIPAPGSAAAPLPAGADLRVAGISPFYTPNSSFYRVDTALLVPQLQLRAWKLQIYGMVDHPMQLDFAELIARDLIERDITLNCVSNEVGGRYIGNARWTGVPLKPLLEEVGMSAAATQIVSRSPDGMTIGTPTQVAMDGRDAMLAVAMNGDPLPFEHGFPVRMLVPGLYGYESGTKWITDMELTTLEAFDAYWVKRGWAQQVLVKTASRIDTPRKGAHLPRGTVAVAGVAWAQHRGIEAVQVRVDGGGWNDARLAVQDTIDTWRQWVWSWQATPGQHTLEVRAVDDTRAVQTSIPAAPFPSGATGWHEIAVSVI